MAYVQNPDLVFRWNGQVHLNWRERQFSRLLAAEVCASVEVMLNAPCSEVVWRVLTTHFIHEFPLHFPSHASPCAITFQLDSTWCNYTVSQLTTRWHYCCLHELLLLVVDTVAYAEAFRALKKAVACVIVEYCLVHYKWVLFIHNFCVPRI